ncbi:hypothetical protein M427DRAFT_389419 [Gonapodya prolifera JEL478]|uniref:Uncharacterized protein n=1 Tax=Gonapodya prolifera (strain JEL478) TaxID=1344416 RepID=A0A139A7U9_GONPJ|nr:hypothetical protein M427DRAFT_389419 [Gonapodya prolifera JEL478]|eukprot:KXS12837.1 hypothetical protein M427DRAFT_389419 [Gonapodya prolifera JEL478]
MLCASLIITSLSWYTIHTPTHTFPNLTKVTPPYFEERKYHVGSCIASMCMGLRCKHASAKSWSQSGFCLLT